MALALDSGLSGATFTLSMAAINAGNQDRTTPVGIQIVEVVTEPTAAALMGIGILAGQSHRATIAINCINHLKISSKPALQRAGFFS